MSEPLFRKFRKFIHEQCGINLAPAKRTMLTVRLQKRLRALGMTSFKDYFDHLTSRDGLSRELVPMIDVVSTNKTDFFREPGHFDFLLNRALPELVDSGRLDPVKGLNIWSAGCSSGEEPYTIGMVASEFYQNNRRGTFSILATDISTRVLNLARNGIYREELTEPVPSRYKRKYMMWGKGSQQGFCRIVPELRERIQLRRLNFVEGRTFGIETPMEIIFCRNVIIYFDRDTQIQLFEKFYDQLVRGGYLFIGHSETLHGINNDFENIGGAVYRKPL
ncbi:MAG: chemotaxis protein CheR [Desulfobacterales bacterium]|nr:chemotaxis protein CheR [Desulfobacterales bacterium]